MLGRWKLTYMEANDIFSKRVFSKSQQNADPDFFVLDVEGVTMVTFTPDTLAYKCKIKAKAIETGDGQQIFQIVELTDDKLELQQMVFNHGGPFGPYRMLEQGKRLSFINMNKEPFQPTPLEVKADTISLNSINTNSISKENGKTKRDFGDLSELVYSEMSNAQSKSKSQKPRKAMYTYIVCTAFWGDPTNPYSDFGHGTYVSNVLQIENKSKDNLAKMSDYAENQIRTTLHDKEQLKLFTSVGNVYYSYEDASNAMHVKLSDKFAMTFHYDGYYQSTE